MRDLGVREWTALGALVFAVLLGFVFLDPANGESGGRRTIRQGDPPPAATPTPAPTTAVVPPSALPAPEGWEVQFASIMNGREAAENPRLVTELDLAYERTPFPDYRDNSWKVTVRASVELGAGSSQFVLRYDAAIRVFVGDSEIASKPEPGRGPEDLVVTFPHEAGRYEIRIEANDTAGAFLLKYQR